MPEAGEERADPLLVGEVELGDDHVVGQVSGLAEHVAPGVHDQALAVADSPVGLLADLVGRDHVDLILDRAGAQQDVPVVLAGAEREGARDQDRARARRDEPAEELGEAQVVADREADGAEARMVAMHSFSAPWAMWEMHPEGSEVVLCTAGSITLHQEYPDGRMEAVTLGPGDYAINEPGVWHTADVETQATALFITAGKGTEHRPR